MDNDDPRATELVVLVVNPEDTMLDNFTLELTKLIKYGLNESDTQKIVEKVKMYFKGVKNVLNFLEIEITGLPCSKIVLPRFIFDFESREYYSFKNAIA